MSDEECRVTVSAHAHPSPMAVKVSNDIKEKMDKAIQRHRKETGVECNIGLTGKFI